MSLQKDNKIQNELGLAPMHGITDFVFRLWFYMISGCTKMTTPFLRVTQTYPHKIPDDWAPDIFSRKIREKLPFKTTLQMMASCPVRFSEAYEMFEEHIDHVELNCGCPSPKVVYHAAGSSLLREVSSFQDFVSQIAERIGEENFCVKIRTGYESTDKFFDLVDSIAPLNLKRLTIHGRTKEQKYMGSSRMDLIHEASLRCDFPVIASGDVVSVETYYEARNKMPHVDGILVGRGALKDPFLFEKIKNSDFSHSKNKSFLYHVFLCYGLLIELWKLEPEKVQGLILEGEILSPFFDDQEKWKDFSERLRSHFPLEGGLPELSTPTLGRLKLLWANLLEGLCSEIDGRALLRKRNTEDFFACLQSLLVS